MVRLGVLCAVVRHVLFRAAVAETALQVSREEAAASTAASEAKVHLAPECRKRFHLTRGAAQLRQ